MQVNGERAENESDESESEDESEDEEDTVGKEETAEASQEDSRLESIPQVWIFFFFACLSSPYFFGLSSPACRTCPLKQVVILQSKQYLLAVLKVSVKISHL